MREKMNYIKERQNTRILRSAWMVRGFSYVQVPANMSIRAKIWTTYSKLIRQEANFHRRLRYVYLQRWRTRVGRLEKLEDAQAKSECSVNSLEDSEEIVTLEVSSP